MYVRALLVVPSFYQVPRRRADSCSRRRIRIMFLLVLNEVDQLPDHNHRHTTPPFARTRTVPRYVHNVYLIFLLATRGYSSE